MSMDEHFNDDEYNEEWLSDKEETKIAKEAYKRFFEDVESVPPSVDKVDSATLIAYSGDEFFTVTATPEEHRKQRMLIERVIRMFLKDMDGVAERILDKRSKNNVHWSGPTLSGVVWGMSVMSMKNEPNVVALIASLIALFFMMYYATKMDG